MSHRVISAVAPPAVMLTDWRAVNGIFAALSILILVIDCLCRNHISSKLSNRCQLICHTAL